MPSGCGTRSFPKPPTRRCVTCWTAQRGSTRSPPDTHDAFRAVSKRRTRIMRLTRKFADSIDIIREAAEPLDGTQGNLDPLLDLIGDARFVLLGEASHG